MADSWFQQGYEVPEEAKQQQNFDDTKYIRYFMKNGETKILILLDDEPFCFFEHHPIVGKNYDLFFTCVKGIPTYEACDGCEANDKRYWVGLLSVINASGYTKKDGTGVPWTKKILPMKAKSIELMKRQKAKRGSLVGARYEVYRGEGQQSPRIGDSWDFEAIMTPAEIMARCKDLKPEDLTPFNYAELFKPKTREEMQQLLRGQELSGAVALGDKEVVQPSDIPF